MNTENLYPGNQETLKSYWNRPAGKFGTIFAIAAIGAALFFLLPILATIVWTTVHIVEGLAILGVVWFILTNETLRANLFFVYELLMKKFVGIWIPVDPFIASELDIRDMKENNEKMQKQIEDATGKEQYLSDKIKKKEKERQDELIKAETAKENTMHPEFTLATRQAARLQEYIDNLTPIRNGLKFVCERLTKLHKTYEFEITDAEQTLELKKDEFNAVTAGSKALNSALNFLKGDPRKKLLAQQSMEYVANDIAQKKANMRLAIDSTSEFMRSIDLENATFEKKGLLMLEEVMNQRIESGVKLPTVKIDDSYQNLLNN